MFSLLRLKKGSFSSSASAGGIDTQLRLAGASPALLLISRASADLLRTALWLCGAVAVIAALGPRALLVDSRPSSERRTLALVLVETFSSFLSSPLLALAALALAAAAASLQLGYFLASPLFAAVLSSPDSVSSAVMQLGTLGTLALILKEAAALAPLLWPAAAEQAREVASLVSAVGSALLPSFNLLRGVLSVALVATGVSGDDDDDDGNGLGMRRAEVLDGLSGTKAASFALSSSSFSASAFSSPLSTSTSTPSFFSWGVAGQPLACLLAQALALALLAWLADGGVASVLASATARRKERRRSGGNDRGDAEAPPLLPASSRPSSLLPSSRSSAPWPLVVSHVSKSYPIAASRSLSRGGGGSSSPSSSSSSSLKALSDVSLSAAPGCCVGVVGANGAGKSTLFALIAGERAADEGGGQVLVCGEEARRARSRGAGTLGFCPQAGSASVGGGGGNGSGGGGGPGGGGGSGSGGFSPLPPELTALEAMVLLSRLRGAPSAAAAAREGRELLAAVGLGIESGNGNSSSSSSNSNNPAAARAAASQPLSTLSGGTARRVAAAAALVGDPKLIVLDEATAGLDTRSRALLWRLLRRRLSSSSSSSHSSSSSSSTSSSPSLPAALVSSHRLAEVEAACDSVVILVAGRVAASGSPQELREALGGFYSVSVSLLRGEGGNSASAASALSAALGPAATLLPPPSGSSSSSSSGNSINEEQGQGGETVLRFRVAAAPATRGGLDLASLYERLEKATAAAAATAASSSSSSSSSHSSSRYSVSQASLEDVFVDVTEREAEREREEEERRRGGA